MICHIIICKTGVGSAFFVGFSKRFLSVFLRVQCLFLGDFDLYKKKWRSNEACLVKSYLLIPVKKVFCVPVDMAGNAESAHRCTNPRTRKRQLSTEKAGKKIGCAVFWEIILVARSAHTGRTLLYQRFCAAKRTGP